MITFTIDLEDPTERYLPDGRHVAITQRILDFCDETHRRATFFITGRVVETAPDLVKDIANRGHEVAYHSYNHVPLTKETPERFRREATVDRDRIQQLIGKNIIGFRAPQFSLTPETLWATDILMELGFRYSSSIMPTSISRFGFQNAPQRPFLWPSGLIELPLPVAKVGSFGVPYLGGIYLYALPHSLVRRWVKQADPYQILWTYTHPYDFDRDEKYASMPHTPAWASMILWLARFVAETKVKKALELGIAPTLGERINSFTILDTYS